MLYVLFERHEITRLYSHSYFVLLKQTKVYKRKNRNKFTSIPYISSESFQWSENKKKNKKSGYKNKRGVRVYPREGIYRANLSGILAHVPQGKREREFCGGVKVCLYQTVSGARERERAGGRVIKSRGEKVKAQE